MWLKCSPSKIFKSKQCVKCSSWALVDFILASPCFNRNCNKDLKGNGWSVPGGTEVRELRYVMLHSNRWIKQVTAPLLPGHDAQCYCMGQGAGNCLLGKIPNLCCPLSQAQELSGEILTAIFRNIAGSMLTAKQFGQLEHSGGPQAPIFFLILASIDVDLGPVYLKRILCPAIMGSGFSDRVSAQACPPLTNKSRVRYATKQIFLSISNGCHWGNC